MFKDSVTIDTVGLDSSLQVECEGSDADRYIKHAPS